MLLSVSKDLCLESTDSNYRSLLPWIKLSSACCSVHNYCTAHKQDFPSSILTQLERHKKWHLSLILRARLQIRRKMSGLLAIKTLTMLETRSYITSNSFRELKPVCFQHYLRSFPKFFNTFSTGPPFPVAQVFYLILGMHAPMYCSKHKIFRTNMICIGTLRSPSWGQWLGSHAASWQWLILYNHFTQRAMAMKPEYRIYTFIGIENEHAVEIRLCLVRIRI